MKQYMLTIYQPDGDPPPPEVLDPIMRDLAVLNEEMRASGAWVFSAGLLPAQAATVVQKKDGELLTTDGPFTEGKEHVGGFTIIQADGEDAALEWGRRLAAVLSPLWIEVREVQGGP
ncbi:hypothetical protein J4573_02025 [Actinomadura barringtoniae]|uniref:YCII-related domain-containing protein n=1 Tax=Actinomadura barringtoniae TaxID=1427535 RepID=A0A939P5T4_9ACTN|nr:YciI family protein [Actinomadura barringtoniae]MBO2445857.1 hypothetical protein [Actinomadura barringtoniae]